MAKENYITGVILAGGASTRMKMKNKALIELEGKPLIEWQLERLFQVFNEVLVVSNNPEFFDYPCVSVSRDKIIRPRKSTLAGIHAGLDEVNTEYGFFFACDMPFVNVMLIKEMMRFCNGHDVLIPCYKNHVEPTFAIYHKNCLPYIEKRLMKDEYRIINFFSEVNVKYLEEEFSKKYDPELTSFFNINTPEDLEEAKKLIKSNGS